MIRFLPRFAGAALAALLLAACDSPEPAPVTVDAGGGPHSFSEPERVLTTALALDLEVDFRRRTLSGYAVLDLDRIDPDHSRLVLDTRDLDIRDVNAVNEAGELRPLSWRLDADHGHLGAPLVIALPADVDRVRIDYATSPEAFGLQWLDGEQTDGGRPFLYSQSQPHYARTWMPVQDTPGVRQTFTATIRAPQDLMAVMAAAGNPETLAGDGVYEFEMPEPVPAYLMALAVGDLEFAATGPRSGVYAPPERLDTAHREFSVLEEMMDIGEDLYGEYRWGRYDLLVLPPSFPFGGMENPRLSFVTPTIIAGDGSLLALVAHELAHSWSGNLVTNATWNDLWLNEGFTVYFEARIMEALYGRERRDMEAVLEYRDLLATLEDTDPADSSLVLALEGRDPEESFSAVPYEMGRLFLDWLEERFGREAFDAFLRSYFDHFAFRSVSTEQFVDYLDRHLLSEHPGRVTRAELEEWLYEPGLPDSAPVPHTDAFDRVDDWRERWLAGDAGLAELPTGEWSVHEWLRFLTGLSGALDSGQMERLDRAFALTGSDNYEILYQWLQRGIETGYEPALDRLETFLLRVGRNKFVEPLYESLAAEPELREWAVDIYQRARPGYHALTRQAAERALGLSDPDEA